MTEIKMSDRMEMVPIKDIKPYKRNPRNNTEAIPKVAESIQRFGFRNPIILDKDNVVIAGHTRLMAAKKLGIKEVPCIWANDLTPDEVKALRLVDNKTAEYAEWELDLLNDELNDINLDLSAFDFDIDMATDDEPIEVQEDDFDEETETNEHGVKQGDIWQLGKHRLMCGDATRGGDVLQLTNKEDIDIVLTDPPYGNGVSGKYGRGQLGIRTILGDEDLTVFKKFIEVMPCSKIIYFLQWRTLTESFESMRNRELKINTVGVWDKKNAGLNGGGGISEQWEAIIFAGDLKYKKFGGNVFNISREQHKREDSPHPHQKPLKLLNEILEFIDGSDRILDVFGGSGSTLIACEQTNRQCYMMELDPHYCDVIISRWEKLTGQQAVKIA